MRCKKHILRANCPYKVVSEMDDNAYKFEFLGDYGVQATYYVGDLSPFMENDVIAELRSIPFKGGGDDTDRMEDMLIEAKDTMEDMVIEYMGENRSHNVRSINGLIYTSDLNSIKSMEASFMMLN